MLRIAGIFDYNILFHNPLMSRFAIIEDVLQVVIAINSVILILFGIPVALVQRDLSRTLNEIAVTYRRSASRWAAGGKFAMVNA